METTKDITELTREEIMVENKRRHNRMRKSFRAFEKSVLKMVTADPEWEKALSEEERDRVRIRHDFVHWARKCAHIRDKRTGRIVAFELNRPQRRLLAVLEGQRMAGRPIRVILLKARQWGGSTMVQLYMAWIQCHHRRNWHSFVCAHQKDTAKTIRAMYTRLLAHYPRDLWPGEKAPKFTPFEGSENAREIRERGCVVTVGSAESQEAARGSDVAMAHLSEVAFWKEATRHSPEDFIRSVCSGIALEPLTMIVLESTANGVGNFFHSEWLRAKAGESAYAPVFVAWHEIEGYSMEVADMEGLVGSLDEYERVLWRRGLTLEQICWYHTKRREFSSHKAMMAEYPSDDVEAFVNTGSSVFDRDAAERLRRDCAPPAAVGDLGSEGVFIPDPTGGLEVWEHPSEESGARYMVTVDVGGRTDLADWSVAAVMRTDCPRPRIVAQWRGHIDHDLLASGAIRLARHYRDALLVVESNTLEQEAVAGGGALYLLELANCSYPNIYRRQIRDSARGSMDSRVGFHTNARTKPLVVTALISAVREGSYVERDERAVNEMLSYEQRPNGSYGARRGHHDDILMTRAIGLYVWQSSDVYRSALCGSGISDFLAGRL